VMWKFCMVSVLGMKMTQTTNSLVGYRTLSLQAPLKKLLSQR
jgi:hypothetical protein